MLIESVFTLISATLSACIVVLSVIVVTAALVLSATVCIVSNIATNSSETCSSSTVAFLIAATVPVIPSNATVTLRTISPTSSFLAETFLIFSAVLSSLDAVPAIAPLNRTTMLLKILRINTTNIANTTVINTKAVNTLIIFLLSNINIIIITINICAIKAAAASISFFIKLLSFIILVPPFLMQSLS